jgi:hypothetical protein
MKVVRKTASVLNEPLEFFGVERFTFGAQLLLSGVVWHLAGFKPALLVFVLASLGAKQFRKWDKDFLFLLPALALFLIHRVFDPMAYEPVQLTIVEDFYEKED